MANARGARRPRASRPTPGAEVTAGSRRWSDGTLFAAIVVLAFVVRLIYLFQIEAIPLFYHLPGDPRTYDAWAQRIAAGDGLGDGVFYQTPLYPCFLALLQIVLGHNLGVVLGRQGRLEEAVYHLQRVAEWEPEFIQARAVLAQFLSMQGKSDEATERQRQGLRVPPDKFRALAGRRGG